MAKILIGEDDEDIKEILKIYLTMQHHQVAVAASKREILAQATNFKPELVLLDIMLNGDDGRDVCKKLKADDRNIKVILLSASCSLLQDYKACNADTFIAKPFDFGHLTHKIDEILSVAKHN